MEISLDAECSQRRKNKLQDIFENNLNIGKSEQYGLYFDWIMTNEKLNDYKLQKYREHLAAFRIQQYYFRAKLHIEYKYCRNRVNKFYDNVVNKKV